MIAFVLILIAMRLEEIAYFMALGANGTEVCRFVIYQVPYIMPIVIPISCLIGSFFVFQNLSQTSQFNALRASGFSILQVVAPVWIVALFFSLASFWISSEISTQSHHRATQLRENLRTTNPLLLLNHRQLMKMKGYIFLARGATKTGRFANNVVIASPNVSKGGIHLLLIDTLSFSNNTIGSQGATLITTLHSNDNTFDDLLIENTAECAAPTTLLTPYLQKSVSNHAIDQLPLSQLLQQWSSAPSQLPYWNELLKRICIGLSPLSLTLMGSIFPLQIQRKNNRSALWKVLGLSLLQLFSFFLGKNMKVPFLILTILYLAPHILIIGCVQRRLRSLERGTA